MVLCIGMMFGATGCGDTGTGTVENKEVTLSLPYGERTGTYSGDMVEGVPDGHGKFETKNEAGETWTYEGDFSCLLYTSVCADMYDKRSYETETGKAPSVNLAAQAIINQYCRNIL